MEITRTNDCFYIKFKTYYHREVEILINKKIEKIYCKCYYANVCRQECGQLKLIKKKLGVEFEK